MWTQPKVNWRLIDYFNIEDWRRIRSNLEHLYDYMLNSDFIPKSLLVIEIGRGYAELPYTLLVNNLETNLERLQEVLGLSLTEDVARKTWYDRLDIMYRENPSCDDWNRWETILLRIYESMQYIDTYIFTPISGTCLSGSERTLLRFSRGR